MYFVEIPDVTLIDTYLEDYTSHNIQCRFNTHASVIIFITIHDYDNNMILITNANIALFSVL